MLATAKWCFASAKWGACLSTIQVILPHLLRPASRSSGSNAMLQLLQFSKYWGRPQLTRMKTHLGTAVSEGLFWAKHRGQTQSKHSHFAAVVICQLSPAARRVCVSLVHARWHAPTDTLHTPRP